MDIVESNTPNKPELPQISVGQEVTTVESGGIVTGVQQGDTVQGDKITYIQEAGDPAELPPPFQAPHKLVNYIAVDQAQEANSFFRQPHDKVAILGVHGYAGVGKSTLAVHLAHQFREEFEDGVLWVDLANERLLQTSLISAALAYGQEDKMRKAVELTAKAQLFTQILADRHVLVVLDSADRSPQLLEWLLPQGQRNIVIINTRNIDKLRQLSTAQLELTPFTLIQTIEYLKLVLGPDRVNSELDAAETLYQLIGGIPQILAIVVGQLQASQSLKIAKYNTLFSNETTRLEDLGNVSDKEIPFIASLEASFSNLKKRSAEIFAMLGVFEGLNFDIWAATAVTNLNDVVVQLALGQLGNQALIHYDDAEGQYTINSLIRSFALSKLENPDEVYKRAAEYFAEKAVQSKLQNGFRDLNNDWDNVAGLMRWAYRSKNWDILVKGVLGLTQFSLGVMGFLDLRGYWTQARELLQLALEGAKNSNNKEAELNIHLNLAGFAFKQQDQTEMERHMADAEPFIDQLSNGDGSILSRIQFYDLRAKRLWQVNREKASDPLVEGVKLLKNADIKDIDYHRGYLFSELSGTYGRSGHLKSATTVAHESLSLLPKWATSAKLVSLMSLGIIMKRTGQISASLKWFEQAQLLAKELGDTNRLASIWLNLANINKQLGRLSDAKKQYFEAYSIFQPSNRPLGIVGTQLGLGQVSFMMGDNLEALHHYEKALELALKFDIKDLQVILYVNLSDLYFLEEAFAQAEEVLAKGEILCQEVGLKYLLPYVLCSQIELLQVQNKHVRVIQEIEKVIIEATKTEDLSVQGVACRILGVSFGKIGEIKKSKIALEKSIELLDDQNKFEHGRSLFALAKVHVDHKEMEQAGIRLQEAILIFEALPAHRELRVVNQLLADLL